MVRLSDLPVLGIRMVQSKIAVIMPGISVCVFFWMYAHGSVFVRQSALCACSVCVSVLFGSVPVRQVVGVYVQW